MLQWTQTEIHWYIIVIYSFSRYPGFGDFKTNNTTTIGRHSFKNLEFSPSDITRFKHAPITSVDVESSFRRYKNILRPIRRVLTLDRLEEINYSMQHMV